MGSTFNCPLLGKVIDDGECYDVQMVRGFYIKPEVLDFQLERDIANEFCVDCNFNQFPLPVK